MELDAVHKGLERFREAQDHSLPSDRKSGHDALKFCIEALTRAIQGEQEAVSCPTRGRARVFTGPLVSLAADRLALVTLRTMYNLIALVSDEGMPPTLSAVAKEIGATAQRERKADCERQRQRDVCQSLLKRNQSAANAQKRAAKIAQAVDEDWSANHAGFHLGEFLAHLAIQHCTVGGSRLFELNEVSTGHGPSRKRWPALCITEAGQQWIEKRNAHHELLAQPLFLPMVVSPKPWTQGRDGGYLNIRLPLIKHGRFCAGENSAYLKAVNAMQDTAWRVNREIYRFLDLAQQSGLHLPGIAPQHPQELPAQLTKEAPLDLIKENRAARRRVHRENVLLASRRALLKLRLNCCAQLVDEPNLYFPHQLDTRGRAYPIPQVFHPQADDIGRALLEFAAAKPLGERGVRWLAIHLANLYGYDKASFDDREDWTRRHEAQILASARAPFERPRFWTHADSPWCFLAACFEWARYCEHRDPDIPSHLPVSVDGTCNGLQHLSALGRDRVGGSATNLTPLEKPQDIYARVAHIVDAQVKADAEAKDPYASVLPKIERKHVKRATMTTPYGVSLPGIHDQLIDDDLIPHVCAWPRLPGKGGDAALPQSDTWRVAHYLAKVLQGSIAQVVIKGTEIMTWLQAVAGEVSKQGSGIRWTLATGFVAVTEERLERERRIHTSARTFVLYEPDPDGAIDRKSQRLAIAPNFVHSLDAAHMMLTVNRLVDQGVRHFAMVHDSYGTHACNVDLLNSELREQFVNLYKQPLLQNFRDEQIRLHPRLTLPNLPKEGDLDIDQVKGSLYFFC